MSYHFDGSRFFMVTDPGSLHGRLMERRGRATITIRFERCDGSSVYQWYVTAEGPIRFTDGLLAEGLSHLERNPLSVVTDLVWLFRGHAATT